MEKEYLLYQKASAEYKELIMRIEKLSGKEALEYAYEKVIKQDILLLIDEGEFEKEEVKALLEMNNPLDFCYQSWLEADCTYMDRLKMTVQDATQWEIVLAREQQRKKEAAR